MEALNGLRMMPSFPPSPLKFRTAGFPQYGFKAGLSDGAFPPLRSLKPAPGIRDCSVGLHPPFAWLWSDILSPALSRGDDPSAMPPFGLTPYPRDPRSDSGCSVPIHHHLFDPIRATGKHVPISRMRGYTERLCCAGAPRPPASGSELSLPILLDMSSSSTPEKSVAAFIQFLRHRHGLHPVPTGSAFSTFPQIRFTRGWYFGASQQFACATTCRFVRPPDGSDSAFALPARTFTFRLSPEQSPDSDAEYGYRGNWTISTDGTRTRWICS